MGFYATGYAIHTSIHSSELARAGRPYANKRLQRASKAEAVSRASFDVTVPHTSSAKTFQVDDTRLTCGSFADIHNTAHREYDGQKLCLAGGTEEVRLMGLSVDQRGDDRTVGINGQGTKVKPARLTSQQE